MPSWPFGSSNGVRRQKCDGYQSRVNCPRARTPAQDVGRKEFHERTIVQSDARNLRSGGQTGNKSHLGVPERNEPALGYVDPVTTGASKSSAIERHAYAGH